jgi:hypothetical protein
MYFMAFSEHEFDQIRPVLSRYACNQCFFHESLSKVGYAQNLKKIATPSTILRNPPGAASADRVENALLSCI